MTQDRYLIWSDEHRRWLEPHGYTWTIGLAGRYTFAEAEAICRQANIAVAKGDQPNEVMVLAPECIRPEGAR